MTHYSQGACHLTERHIEANKIRTLLDIAEKTVKDLLDLGKITLNFFGHLPDQQFFLGQTRHLVEERYLRTQMGGGSGETAMDSRNRDIDLMSKIVAKPLQIVLSILCEQNRRCHLHG